ncbi:N-formylglutamate amidohydrolase [Altererythrobacter salegens]|uniref:N-formylglutamate amidohydrolase n=1 Tax=Croceibacterium salegens TaxID=1737568 RepID=A0A6I4ST45_9SPHN|nr:N-formylglutamate amidohydrolase [Croceibacterium salegens]MXO59181.1 N-formylglutamate amidohydrolase [Croceibacterium salegens]
MSDSVQDSSEFPLNGCGSIPGAPSRPAYSLGRRMPSPIPVFIAVPHAGRTYPRSLLAQMRDPARIGIRLEDRHADLIACEVARTTGAGLLIAHAPRAMIDLNRAPDEMDWDMLVEGRPNGRGALRTSRRARGGLGLVPRRLPGMGELWKQRLPQAELRRRVEEVHVPYHAALSAELVALHDRWGHALLIDLHSMPPLSETRDRHGAAEFVIGDRFGSSCSGALCAAAFDHLASCGRRAAHNRPYAGGYVLDRHASPSSGIHAFQLEVCRAAYLDADLREPGSNFAAVCAVIAGLVRRLADEMGQLGNPTRLAAE